MVQLRPQTKSLVKTAGDTWPGCCLEPRPPPAPSGNNGGVVGEGSGAKPSWWVSVISLVAVFIDLDVGFIS